MLTPSTAFVSGSIRKRATCESCGHQYEYELKRTASGTYSGFAWTASEGEEKAAIDAQENLRYKLENECDVEPCPKCGGITWPMQAQQRSDLGCGVAMVVVGMSMAIGASLIYQATDRLWGLLLAAGIIGFGMALVGGLLLVFIIAAIQGRKAKASQSGSSQDAPTSEAEIENTMPGTSANHGAGASGATKEPEPNANASRHTRIREDCRTLREFYPDNAKRHELVYCFAHRFLPAYVHRKPGAFFMHLLGRDLPGGAMDPTRFIQSRWSMMELNLGLRTLPPELTPQNAVFHRVTDLSMTLHTVAGQPTAIVTMPSPELPAEAFFSAVVLQAPAAQPENWSADIQARVFTLEVLFESPFDFSRGMLCEWTPDGTHQNYGVLIPARHEAFLRAVQSLVTTPDAAPQISSQLPQGGQHEKMKRSSDFASSPQQNEPPANPPPNPEWRIC